MIKKTTLILALIFLPLISAFSCDSIGDGLRTDAITYWTMNEASGARIDATGNGNDLLTTNDQIGEIGKVGNAVSLSGGINQGLEIDDISKLVTFGDSFTIATWVKFSSLDGYSGQEFIPIFITDSSGNLDYYITVRANDKLLAFGITGSDFSYPEVTANGFGTVPINEWLFIVAKFVKGDGLYLSVNNGAFDHVAYTLPNVDSVIDMNGYFRAGAQVSGAMDETGIWRRALSQEEVDYLWNDGAGRSLYP